MKRNQTYIRALGAALALLCLAGCGRGKAPAASGSPAPAETAAPVPTPTPAPTAPAEGPKWGESVYEKEFSAPDGTALLSVRYVLPRLENAVGYPPYEAVNDYYAGVEADLIAAAESRAGEQQGDYELSQQSGLPFAASSEEMSCALTRADGRCVSVLRTFYITAEGAAHPTVYCWSEQLDLERGEKLTFADCFTDPDAAAERARQAVISSGEAKELEAAGVTEGALSAAFQPEHYYLTPDGFVFWYQGGELGPGAPVEIPVGYGVFGDLLASWVQGA